MTSGLIGFGGLPARGPSPSAAIRLSAARLAIARRVASVALAICGVSTTFGSSSKSRIEVRLAFEHVEARRRRCALSRSASTSAASSTMPPRAMFVERRRRLHQREFGRADRVMVLLRVRQHQHDMIGRAQQLLLRHVLGVQLAPRSPARRANGCDRSRAC